MTDGRTDEWRRLQYPLRFFKRRGHKERAVAHASCGLKPSEKNYLAHKLEFFVLKWAI